MHDGLRLRTVNNVEVMKMATEHNPKDNPNLWNDINEAWEATPTQQPTQEEPNESQCEGECEGECDPHCECQEYRDQSNWDMEAVMSIMQPSTGRQCEMIGCIETGTLMHSIAPGTTVWLCPVCIYRETKGLGEVKDED